MADEVKQDATPEPSSAITEAIASSPEALAEEPQGTETGTPQQPVSQEKEPPFNEHPRFKELIEERNFYRQQLERATQPQSQPQQPEQAPQELGNTPEEREFWRMQRKIAREEAERVSKEQLGRINPVIEAGRMELAQMKVQQFRATHTDVKENSPEEIAIAERISAGYLPEDAYRVVMWDKKVAQAEQQGNTQLKQRMEAKKQANVEQRSIPSGATPPTKEKLTLRQRIEREAANLEF